MSQSPTEADGGGTAAQNGVLDRGDIVNLLGRFRRRLREDGRRLTVVQNRLIMRRIEEAGLIASGAVQPDRQLSRIAGVVADLVPMPAEDVEEELRACQR